MSKKCPDKDLTDGLHDMWEDLDKKERASTKKLCPKCGSELPLEEGWDSMVYHCKKCHVVIDADTGEACEIVHLETLYERGHEEKVDDRWEIGIPTHERIRRMKAHEEKP